MGRIVYIGNKLSKKSNYHTAMATLSNSLRNEGYRVDSASDKKNKLRRLFDMCSCIFRNRKKASYVLIDTMSTSNFYFALICSQLCRILALKYIPILHGGNLPYRLDNYSFLSALIFKNAHKICTPSVYMQEAFKNRGYESIYIPNAIPMTDYNFKSREKIKCNLLWVRAFDKIYNPSLAVRALALIKEKIDRATLCMVGPDDDGSMEKVKQLVQQLGVDQQVKITGALPKKEWHQLSESYDIFINTANIDNVPVSVVEAMALGLTVISTKVGGMPFLIDHGKNGILVEKDNEVAMANAVLGVMETNGGKLAVVARIKAETFDWNQTRSKWLSLLNK